MPPAGSRGFRNTRAAFWNCRRFRDKAADCSVPRVARHLLFPWCPGVLSAPSLTMSTLTMRSIRFVIVCALAAPFAGAYGCGGSESSSGASAGAAGSGGSSAGAAGSSAGAAGSSAGTAGSSAGAGGAQSCGTTTCGPTQYCVIPCCGGAPQACVQALDGGACPSGTVPGCFSAPSYTCVNAANCCQPAPCTPPPPYCSDTAPPGCPNGQGRTCRLACG